MMTKEEKMSIRFAVCIETDDPDMLTPSMMYRVLPDDDAEKSGYLRIIDNEGEDYLYPAGYFVIVDLPHSIKQTLLRTDVPIMRSVV